MTIFGIVCAPHTCMESATTRRTREVRSIAPRVSEVTRDRCTCCPTPVIYFALQTYERLASLKACDAARQIASFAAAMPERVALTGCQLTLLTLLEPKWLYQLTVCAT